MIDGGIAIPADVGRPAALLRAVAVQTFSTVVVLVRPAGFVEPNPNVAVVARGALAVLLHERNAFAKLQQVAVVEVAVLSDGAFVVGEAVVLETCSIRCGHLRR